MTCTPLDFGNGVTGFACSRGSRTRCVECKQRASSKLCDYRLSGAKTGSTCDRKLCSICAVNVGPDRDYCQAHAKLKPKRKRSEVSL